MTLVDIRALIGKAAAESQYITVPRNVLVRLVDVAEMAQMVTRAAVWVSEDYYLPVMTTHREELEQVVKDLEKC